MFGGESGSYRCTKGREIIQEKKVIFLRKILAQQNWVVGEILSLLRMEAGSVGFSWCLIRIGVTKYAVCKAEQPGNEGELYISVSADRSEAFASSIIGAGGFKFDVLGMQFHPDGYIVSNIYECSYNEEVMGALKVTFEVGSKFVSSE